MSEERGLVVAEKVIAGTERIHRGPDWWNPGDPGTRRRAGLIDVETKHWTAGHTGRTGPQVIRAMKARATAAKPIETAIHFVVQWDGVIWQAADPGLTAVVHVGWSPIYRRSVGEEHCWPGSVRQATKLGEAGAGEHDNVQACGFRMEILRPALPMIEASVWLSETLASLEGEGGIFIPRQVPSELGRRFTREEGRRWAGVMEHINAPTTRKLDCAGRLLAALAEAGWRVRAP